MKKTGLITALILLLIGCSDTVKVKQSEKKVKNIILLIGDGMGVTQVYAAMSVSEKILNFEKFKHIGFHKTYSANNYITDSGAGGTALSTGFKTANHCIATDSTGKPLKTILEYAEENGLATGLVSTSSILHATPASFIAHEKNRNDYENIARDFLDVDINIFIGGGKKQFIERKDSLNLIDSLKHKNYNVIDGVENFNAEMDGKYAVFTAPEHNPKMLDGRGNMLPESTKKAIKLLNKNPNGFFLMVEGSQIDWGGHENDIDYVTTETLDFDNAIAQALKFAEKNKETLVIVTADHETGGLTLPGGNLKSKTIEAKFTTKEHTAVMAPVFAYGPGAESFGGIYENTDIFKKMMKLLGLE